MKPYTLNHRRKRTENSAQRKKQKGGYLTVFVCLLFVVISGAAFVCLDGICLFQGKSKSVMLQAGVGEHLMANYNEPLASRYHLYYLDPRMERTLKDRASAYLEDALGDTGFLTGSHSFLNLSVKEVQVQAYNTMDKDQHRSFIAQINEYMKYEVAKDALLELLSGTAEDAMTQQEQMDNLIDRLEQPETSELRPSEEGSPDKNADTALTPSSSAEQKEAVESAQKTGLVRKVSRILKNGVFEYVTEGLKISDHTVSSSLLPSQTQREQKPQLSFQLFENIHALKSLLGDQNYEKIAEGLEEKAVLALYNRKYFGNYMHPLDNTSLQYEYEYILGGQLTDRDNLEYVINRLVLLRFGLNAVSVFQDSAKIEEAQLLAAGIAGLSGSSALVETVKYVILAAISFGEAIEDVKILIRGGDVSFLVKKETSPGQGLNYEEYLTLLFCMEGQKSRQCYRMQDLIQLNIRKEQPDFLIKDCFETVKVNICFRQKPVFFPGQYQYAWVEEYSY